MDTLERPPETAPSDEPSEPEQAAAAETVLVQQLRYYVAMWSFAAALLHVLAMIDHRSEPTLARGFLAIAVIQVAWGVLLIADPRRLFVLIGAIATACAVAVWVLSRTKGISWFPGLDHVEALGWRDVVTQIFQLLALGGAAVILLPATWHRPAGKKIDAAPIAIIAVLTMLTLGVLYVATHAGHAH